MLIKIEDLAPKTHLNFFLPRPLVADNAAAFFRQKDAQTPAPAAALLDIDGVKSCLLTDVLVGVAYNENANKEDVKALVLAELIDYLEEKHPLLPVGENRPDNIELLEALADSFIRPTLNRDKGDVKIISCTDNNLLLQFTGHCAGCPYAQNTLNNVIVRCFKRYVPLLNDIRIKD